MNVLTVLLQAPAGAAGGGSMMWIMLIAMFVIMYFFMIRPQNKKQKEIANFRKSLQVNQNVITAGGIHGTIKEITDDYIVLELLKLRIKIYKNLFSLMLHLLATILNNVINKCLCLIV
jgi:preprotein translocase subunit YajC